MASKNASKSSPAPKNAKSSKPAPAAAPAAESKPAAPVKIAKPRDAFGGRLNTRGHVINAVIIEAAGRPLTMAEIKMAVLASPLHAEYVKHAGGPVEAIANHMLALVKAGHVSHDAAGYKLNAETHADLIAPAAKPAAKPRKAK